MQGPEEEQMCLWCLLLLCPDAGNGDDGLKMLGVHTDTVGAQRRPDSGENPSAHPISLSMTSLYFSDRDEAEALGPSTCAYSGEAH